MALFIRRGDVPTQTRAANYKPHLRIDFRWRCAYCGTTEIYRRGIDVFGVDHFRPKAKFPELDCHYPNLCYCCNQCNSHKGSAWPSTEREAAGDGFIDPCVRDAFEHDLSEDSNGRVSARTEAGSYTLRRLSLNRPELIRFRLRRRAIGDRIEKLREIVKRPESQLDATRRQAMDEILDELRLEWEATFKGAPWESYGPGV